MDLRPRTVEEQKHCATNFHHGRGIWHVRRLQTRRRDQLTLPQTHCQSPDGQSDHTHHRRLLKFKLPHCGQVQSPSFFFHFQSGSASRCMPHSHHCVKRLLIHPQDVQAQQCRSSHASWSSSKSSSCGRLFELDALDPVDLEPADPEPSESNILMIDPFSALRSSLMDPRAFEEKQMDPRGLSFASLDGFVDGFSLACLDSAAADFSLACSVLGFPLACLDSAVAANLFFSLACSVLGFPLASLDSAVAANLSFSAACSLLDSLWAHRVTTVAAGMSFSLASLVSAVAANLAFSTTCSWDFNLAALCPWIPEGLLEGARLRRTLDLEELRGDVGLMELERPRENVRRRLLLRHLARLRTLDLERLRTLDLERLRGASCGPWASNDSKLDNNRW